MIAAKGSTTTFPNLGKEGSMLDKAQTYTIALVTMLVILLSCATRKVEVKQPEPEDVKGYTKNGGAWKCSPMNDPRDFFCVANSDEALKAAQKGVGCGICTVSPVSAAIVRRAVKQ